MANSTKDHTVNKRPVLGISVILVALGVTAYLTRYEYFKISPGDGIELELRTNRYTNETDMLNNRGWGVVQTSEEWETRHWNRTHPAYFTPDGSESK